MDKFFEYLPNILEQLDSTERIIGLAVLLVPVIVFAGLNGMQQPLRGLLSIATFFGALIFLYLILVPRAQQMAEELAGASFSPQATNQALEATVTSADGQVFPDSSERLLTQQDVAGKSAWALQVARNEIFARRGRFFRSDALRKHFEQFEWYKPTTWSPTLNSIENANVAFIQAAEASL